MMQHDQESKVLYQLCSLLIGLIQKQPLPSTCSSTSMTVCVRQGKGISLAGFASLLLGMSLALMLCGSVTFVLGFFLFPWVIVLATTLYLCGLLSYLSWVGRALFSTNFNCGSVRKEIPNKCGRAMTNCS